MAHVLPVQFVFNNLIYDAVNVQCNLSYTDRPFSFERKIICVSNDFVWHVNQRSSELRREREFTQKHTEKNWDWKWGVKLKIFYYHPQNRMQKGLSFPVREPFRPYFICAIKIGPNFWTKIEDWSSLMACVQSWAFALVSNLRPEQFLYWKVKIQFNKVTHINPVCAVHTERPLLLQQSDWLFTF